MERRRNAYTAVLFLIALSAAAIYLFLGLLPRNAGFREAGRSLRSDQSEPLSSQFRIAPVRATSGRITFGPADALEALDRAGRAAEDFIAGAESSLHELLDRDHLFIQIYGGGQKLLHRQVLEDADPRYTVVRLTDKVLTFANLNAQPVDMTQRAQDMVAFARRVERRFDIPLVYVQAPAKADLAELPSGVEDYSTAEADQFLSILEGSNIDTLDLRDVFRTAQEEDRKALEELFFPTDHHWTPAGAFLGFQTLCEHLTEHYDMEIPEEVTNSHQYNRYTFDQVFLGSQGKRVGSLYAGVDSIEIWSPKFSNDFTYTVAMTSIRREGPFAASLLFTERLADSGLYDTNPYAIYSGGDYLLTQAVNEKNPDGPCILVLRDSFGCAFTPFLSLACGKVITMDCRNFNGDQEDMMAQIDWLDPDLIVVLNSTSSLRVDNLFPYLPSTRQAVLAEREAAKEAAQE